MCPYQSPGILHQIQETNAPGLLARQWPRARRQVVLRAWWQGFVWGATFGSLVLMACQLGLAAWVLR